MGIASHQLDDMHAGIVAGIVSVCLFVTVVVALACCTKKKSRRVSVTDVEKAVRADGLEAAVPPPDVVLKGEFFFGTPGSNGKTEKNGNVTRENISERGLVVTGSKISEVNGDTRTRGDRVTDAAGDACQPDVTRVHRSANSESKSPTGVHLPEPVREAPSGPKRPPGGVKVFIRMTSTDEDVFTVPVNSNAANLPPRSGKGSSSAKTSESHSHSDTGDLRLNSTGSAEASAMMPSQNRTPRKVPPAVSARPARRKDIPEAVPTANQSSAQSHLTSPTMSTTNQSEMEEDMPITESSKYGTLNAFDDVLRFDTVLRPHKRAKPPKTRHRKSKAPMVLSGRKPSDDLPDQIDEVSGTPDFSSLRASKEPHSEGWRPSPSHVSDSESGEESDDYDNNIEAIRTQLQLTSDGFADPKAKGVTNGRLVMGSVEVSRAAAAITTQRSPGSQGSRTPISPQPRGGRNHSGSSAPVPRPKPNSKPPVAAPQQPHAKPRFVDSTQGGFNDNHHKTLEKTGSDVSNASSDDAASDRRYQNITTRFEEEETVQQIPVVASRKKVVGQKFTIANEKFGTVKENAFMNSLRKNMKLIIKDHEADAQEAGPGDEML